MTYTKFLVNEHATHELASTIAEACEQRTIIYLYGDLGAGKTSFAKGFLRGLGYSGNVKSPTYTLVEPYELESCRVFHFDLYRLSDPEELEYMGIRDYFSADSMCLIEWPDKGGALLASADLEIKMSYEDSGRRISVHAVNDYGQQIIKKLK